MHDHRPILLQRVQRTLTERIRPAESTAVAPLDVSAFVAGEPVSWAEASGADYRPVAIGDAWGLPWQTVWFRFETHLPAGAGASDYELVIDLGWLDHSAGFQCEGLVRDADGTVLKAINPRNRWVPVRADAEGRVQVYVEAAANPLLLDVPPFQPTPLGDPATLTDQPLYRLARAELVRIEPTTRELIADVDVLLGLAENLPADSARGWSILLALGRAIDQLDLADVPRTAAAARAELTDVLATPAYADAHQLFAAGHAHIDSAWLWPIRETRRKVARTMANALRLIEDGSGMIFTLPAAQHLAWLAESEPELFQRLRTQVTAGSMVPVGGMWIEPDAVLPGGEAMARQLTEGLDYFERELGVTCREVWLPDSFGYSAAIPQLAKLAGIDWFLTQKISWNQVDTFPHHTLWWEGLDGSRIFTHFPPVDTYGSEVTGRDLDHASRNFKEKGRASVSLMPFGYGDGGGGPTREMLQRIERTADLAGSPKVTMASPHTFFERAEAEYADAPVWVGELYLELHRGTFTTQVATKQGNRRSEALMRTVELWCTAATVLAGAPYPHEELRQTWHKVLLGQFHDILPGTSIAWVYDEVAQLYAEVAETAERLIGQALEILGLEAPHRGTGPVAFNAGPWPVTVQGTEVPALGSAVLARADADASAVVVERADDGGVRLSNEQVAVRFDPHGLITELVDRSTGRDVVPPGQRLGELQLHQDFPNMWDAWDIDPFYRGSQRSVEDVRLESVEETEGAATVIVSARFDDSTAELRWTLPAAARRLDLGVSVDWQEREKLLKLSLPVDVHTDHAQYETQFGHLVRPTHENTSWDAFRFEVSCHRWLRVAEPGWGLGITNRATYGWDVTRHARDGGGTYSVVRASLVRGPRFPDPDADRGRHEFGFSLLPGADTQATVADAYRANLDPVVVADGAVLPSLLRVEGAVVESVSVPPVSATDVSDPNVSATDVVVRLYEPLGARSRVVLAADWAAECRGVDLRWRDSDRAVAVTATEQGWQLDLRPFEIATLRLTVAAQPEHRDASR